MYKINKLYNYYKKALLGLIIYIVKPKMLFKLKNSNLKNTNNINIKIKIISYIIQ